MNLWNQFALRLPTQNPWKMFSFLLSHVTLINCSFFKHEIFTALIQNALKFPALQENMRAEKRHFKYLFLSVPFVAVFEWCPDKLSFWNLLEIPKWVSIQAWVHSSLFLFSAEYPNYFATLTFRTSSTDFFNFFLG